jgi:hypothetical protein
MSASNVVTGRGTAIRFSVDERPRRAEHFFVRVARPRRVEKVWTSRLIVPICARTRRLIELLQNSVPKPRVSCVVVRRGLVLRDVFR